MEIKRDYFKYAVIREYPDIQSEKFRLDFTKPLIYISKYSAELEFFNKINLETNIVELTESTNLNITYNFVYLLSASERLINKNLKRYNYEK